ALVGADHLGPGRAGLVRRRDFADTGLARHHQLFAGQHRQDGVPAHLAVDERDGDELRVVEDVVGEVGAGAEVGRIGFAVVRVEVKDDLANLVLAHGPVHALLDAVGDFAGDGIGDGDVD